MKDVLFAFAITFIAGGIFWLIVEMIPREILLSRWAGPFSFIAFGLMGGLAWWFCK